MQEALDLKAFPDARVAITEFAKLLVDACARGEKLGFALQQTNLGAQLESTTAPETTTSKRIETYDHGF